MKPTQPPRKNSAMGSSQQDMSMNFPIDPKFVKRVKNSWSESIDLLQDLKSKKSTLHNQLVSEIIALK